MDKFYRSFPLQSGFFMTQNNNIVSGVGLVGYIIMSNNSSSLFQFCYYRDIVSQTHVSGMAALVLLGACILLYPQYKWHHTHNATLSSVAKNNNNICIPLRSCPNDKCESVGNAILLLYSILCTPHESVVVVVIDVFCLGGLPVKLSEIIRKLRVNHRPKRQHLNRLVISRRFILIRHQWV